MSILVSRQNSYRNKSYKDFNKLNNNKINEEIRSVIS